MMCMRFVFLLITRLAAWQRLSRRKAWKTAEILILRHQLAVVPRPSPGPPGTSVPAGPQASAASIVTVGGPCAPRLATKPGRSQPAASDAGGQADIALHAGSVVENTTSGSGFQIAAHWSIESSSHGS